MMKNCLSLMLLLLFSCSLIGQVQWYTGLNAKLAAYRTSSSDIVSGYGQYSEENQLEWFQVESNEHTKAIPIVGIDLGVQFGNRIGIKGQIGYGFDFATNYTMKQDGKQGSSSIESSFLAFDLVASYEISRGIKPFIGMSSWYFLEREASLPIYLDTEGLPSSAQAFRNSLNLEREIWYSIKKTENEWLLSLICGLEVELGAFSLIGTYGKGITPIGEGLDVRGTPYDFTRRLFDSFTVGFTYKLFRA